MKVKNGEIGTLIEFLLKLEMTARESRMRARFISLLDEKNALYEKEKKEIIYTYAKKDEYGNVIISRKENDASFYESDRVDEFKTELFDLFSEEMVIDETEERKEMLVTIRDAFLRYDVLLSGLEAIYHDKFCTMFEEMKY